MKTAKPLGKRISLYPLTLEEAVDKVLAAGTSKEDKTDKQEARLPNRINTKKRA